jgi:hypothetical protein
MGGPGQPRRLRVVRSAPQDHPPVAADDGEDPVRVLPDQRFGPAQDVGPDEGTRPLTRRPKRRPSSPASDGSGPYHRGRGHPLRRVGRAAAGRLRGQAAPVAPVGRGPAVQTRRRRRGWSSQRLAAAWFWRRWPGWWSHRTAPGPAGLAARGGDARCGPGRGAAHRGWRRPLIWLGVEVVEPATCW